MWPTILTCAQRAVLGHRLERLSVPGVADHGRERVPLAREDLHHLRELRLDDEPALLADGQLVIAGVGDLGDKPFAGAHSGGDAVLHEA